MGAEGAVSGTPPHRPPPAAQESSSWGIARYHCRAAVLGAWGLAGLSTAAADSLALPYMATSLGRRSLRSLGCWQAVSTED